MAIASGATSSALRSRPAKALDGLARIGPMPVFADALEPLGGALAFFFGVFDGRFARCFFVAIAVPAGRALRYHDRACRNEGNQPFLMSLPLWHT